MDMEKMLQQIDRYYRENQGECAEKLMQEGIRQAIQEQDDTSLLQLLNELLGYYRETSQAAASYKIAEQAIGLTRQMGLEGTIPYATTLLNAANAYRAGGRLADSLAQYLLVKQVYDKQLEPRDMLNASLENNLSLLYQEMGEFHQAKNCLQRALSIVEGRGEQFETAVSCANLASTCLQLSEMEEALDYAGRAKNLFEQMGVEDAHYGAALAALGTYDYRTGEYAGAQNYFRRAMKIMEQNLGRNEYYERLHENVRRCEEALLKQRQEQAFTSGGWQESGMEKGKEIRDEGTGEPQQSPEQDIQGLTLSRMYYEQCVAPMLQERFPSYADRIAAGLAGEGSDCFGYDDVLSRDHDWGPDVCLWITDETYEAIGKELERAYDALPKEWKGCSRTISAQGRGRRGVMTIKSFYTRLLGTADYEEIDWSTVTDASLAAAVNGRVFRDEEGIFSRMRTLLVQGYPERIHYLKLAEAAARFSRSGQYNWERMYRRGDMLTADMMRGEGIKAAMELFHYSRGAYPPHDKWLSESVRKLEGGAKLTALLEKLQERALDLANVLSRREKQKEADSAGAQRDGDSSFTPGARRNTVRLSAPELPADEMSAAEQVKAVWEETGAFLAQELYARSLISDTDSYLDSHTPELLAKASLAERSNEQLVEEIVRLEFEAFDKVQNVGGRAGCQNDWATFSIMRRSQYQTWSRTMLLQYLFDFYREFHSGHNLIEEKYGRMMESTAPEEYEKLKNHFPALTSEKKAIIQQIVALQVEWMEEFAAKYPHLAGNARSIHSIEDNLYNTSYETYLRGELGTYSDKMLELYGRYVVDYAARGANLATEIMTNSTLAYGYESLDAAERFLS